MHQPLIIKNGKKKNLITPTILLLALGIHAIFEGIAAGVAS